MSKKSNTKYLLIGVVVIYVAIIMRFFMLSTDDNQGNIDSSPIASFTPRAYEVVQDFTIANNHRDPFLRSLPKIVKNKKSSIKKKSSQPIVSEYYPSIQYRGLVSDRGTAKKVVSLVINNKEYIVREGNTIDSVKIHLGTPKELTVSYKEVIKKVKISN